MIIETPAGAFAAVATLVVGADRMATEEERDFIFGRMMSLEVFRNLDGGELKRLLADTTEEVCSAFPNEDGRVTDDGVTECLHVVTRHLTPELRTEAFRMAVDLARADGVVLEEQTLLQQLRDGLGIDTATANRTLGLRA
jgi:hypothetical protein